MHKKAGHHPDYAKIAQLERELGIAQPVADPLPERVVERAVYESVVRSRPAPPPPAPVIKKPDTVCAQCIAGKPPAHGCIFYPVCRS